MADAKYWFIGITKGLLGEVLRKAHGGGKQLSALLQ
jgi:hypothetical protein